MILKRFAIYLSVILLASACHNSGEPKKPDNLIAKEKMVDILIDAKLIALANSVNRKIMKEHGVKLNTYVYTKHNIDSLQFALSNEYYAFHIKDYEAIYVKVKDSLEILKIKFIETEERIRAEQEEKGADSLELITEKDALGLFKIKDSAKVFISKDSLSEKLIQKELEENSGLVAPISDRNHQ